MVNRVVAALVAGALAVAGLVVALEALAAAFGAGPWLLPRDEWYRAAVSQPWSSPDARRFFGSVAAAGLTLVLLPRAFRREATISRRGPGGSEVVLVRRDVERQLARAAGAVPGVSKTRATLRGRRLRLTGEAAFGLSDALRPGVTSAVKGRLSEIGVDPEPAVSVHLRKGGDR